MSPLKADKKAQSLVPQIVEAHDALTEAETKGFKQSLALAIDLGVLLKLAKEAVYHGHWQTWFEAQKFKFSYRSANRYMRFADHREKLEEAANSPRVADLAAEGELSIRRAEVLLAPDQSEKEKPRVAGGQTAKRAEKEARKAAETAATNAAIKSQDLALVLESTAPDELLKAIKDNETKTELLKQQLCKADPFRVFDLLAETWSESDLQKLAELLTQRRPRMDMKRRPGLEQPQISAQL